jgi:hypothetical protein
MSPPPQLTSIWHLGWIIALIGLLITTLIAPVSAAHLNWMVGDDGGGADYSRCSDSDGGHVPLVFGFVTGYFAANQTRFNLTDRCTGPTTLYEAACSSDSDYMQWYEDCGAFGCAGGRCLNRALTCVDSNPAFSAGGNVTGYTISGQPYLFADTCLSDTVQLDYYCDSTLHQPRSSPGPCRLSEGGTHCIQDHCAP